AGIAWFRGGTVDAWAVRLPTALAALLLVLGVLAALWRRDRLTAGIFAAGRFGNTPALTGPGPPGRRCMPLFLSTAISIAALVHARRQETALRAVPACLTGYLALAAGVLLKGPIGAVLPLAVVAIHSLVEGDWRPQRWWPLAHRLGLWWGLPLAAGL